MSVTFENSSGHTRAANQCGKQRVDRHSGKTDASAEGLKSNGLNTVGKTDKALEYLYKNNFLCDHEH
jgi:hypothetical protein